MSHKIGELEEVFVRWSKGLERRVAQNQQIVAEELCEDIKSRAPINTGRYRNSIKVSKTKVEKGKITTQVFTDLLVGGDNPKWANVPLGAFLEWGTGMKGASTGEATKHGYSYRLTPWCYYSEELGHWVVTDGIVARPHFSTGLNAIKPKYRKMLMEALKK